MDLSQKNKGGRPSISKGTESLPGNAMITFLSGAYQLYITPNNKAQFLICNVGCSAYVQSGESAALTPGVWSFVEGWTDKSKRTIYVNVNNGTPTSYTWASGTFYDGVGTSHFNIGGRPVVDASYFDGLMDEVAFYKRVLTSAERNWLYNSGAGRTYTDVNPPMTNPGTTGLSAWWSMNEASGARADSHSTNSLTDNNTVDFALGLKGNAASFIPLNNEYLSIADNAALSTGNIDFSMAANVYLNSTASTMIIANKGDKVNMNARDFTLYFDQATSKFGLRVGNGTTSAVVLSANTIAAGQWYTILAWHNSVSDTLNIQVNNGSVSSVSYVSGGMDSTFATSIGAFADGTYVLDGRIDEVAFYKRVLNSSERAWIFNSGAGRTYSDLTASQASWQTRTYTYAADIPHAVTALTSGQSTLANYAYDANGNMTCRVEGNSIYKQTYNAENRISSIQKLRSGACADSNPPLETKWDFAYDGDGVRTATLTTPFDATGLLPQTSTLTSYYFGGAYEVTGSSIKKYYSFGGQTILRDANGLKYMFTDHLGSVVAITDAAGTLITQQRYLPFGGERTNVPLINPSSTDYGYTGQRKLDSGMGGIIDYKARFYSPYINHFLQPDTLIPDPSNPQAWNRYSYTQNNPIKYNDPSGHDIGSGISDFGAGLVTELVLSNIWIAALIPQVSDKLVVKNSESEAMLAGRVVGDLVSMAIGVAEVAAGLGTDVGGTIIGCGTSACLGAIPAIAISDAIIVQGSVTTLTAARSLGGNLAMMAKKAKGQSSKDSGDIEQVNAVAKKLGMSQEERFGFGDYLEDEKYHGEGGSTNSKHDFSFKQLLKKAKTFLDDIRKGK